MVLSPSLDCWGVGELAPRAPQCWVWLRLGVSGIFSCRAVIRRFAALGTRMEGQRAPLLQSASVGCQLRCVCFGRYLSPLASRQATPRQTDFHPQPKTRPHGCVCTRAAFRYAAVSLPVLAPEARPHRTDSDAPQPRDRLPTLTSSHGTCD